MTNSIKFNLSHTVGAIVLGVAKNRNIGVDVERTIERRITAQSLGRFFAEDECRAILRVPNSMRPAVFYSYWTLKEAYVKACGTTLSSARRRVHFAIDGERVTACFPWTYPTEQRWDFQLYQPTDVHLLSLCLEVSDGRGIRYVTHREVSFNAENVTVWPLLLYSRERLTARVPSSRV